MNYRYMRLLLFFDLPMLTEKDKREYAEFHRFLEKSGFIMMQKSVYSKLVLNNVASAAVKQRIKNNLPTSGLVELLEITENQFARMEYLVGKEQQLTIDTVDRLVEL